MSSLPPILLAACGNEMAGDDAFGPAVAEALARDPIPGVEILNLGMNPSALLDRLPGRLALIVVDAATAPDATPGSLLEVDWDAPRRPEPVSQAVLSSHGFSIADQIELARRLGLLPPAVRLLALMIEPPGPEPAPGRFLKKQVPAAVRCIREFARAFLANPCP